MKKGYKRLIVFIAFLIAILFVNAFIINFLSGYKMILFILLLLVFFKYYFVFEKDKHRYMNDILFEVLICIISFFIMYYLLGLVVGLTRIQNYYTFNGIKNFVLPIILYTVLREIFRYNMLCKSEGNMTSMILVVALFVMFDISNKLYFSPVNTPTEVFKFISLVFLPTISFNISYSYISRKMGYKPIILFDLVFVLFPYLIPIIPSPNEYIVSIINIIVPILFALRIFRFFKLKCDDEIKRDYHKKKLKGVLLPVVVIFILIYFYSGYFRYYAVAVASGSMKPKINIGDTVIVDQKYNNLKINDVIAYKKNNIIIVHRIVDKIKVKNTYYYYTKGDANSNMDNIVIKKEMIVGRVKTKIPVFGYPTVWFNRLVKE